MKLLYYDRERRGDRRIFIHFTEDENAYSGKLYMRHLMFNASILKLMCVHYDKNMSTKGPVMWGAEAVRVFDMGEGIYLRVGYEDINYKMKGDSLSIPKVIHCTLPTIYYRTVLLEDSNEPQDPPQDPDELQNPCMVCWERAAKTAGKLCGHYGLCEPCLTHLVQSILGPEYDYISIEPLYVTSILCPVCRTSTAFMVPHTEDGEMTEEWKQNGASRLITTT